MEVNNKEQKRAGQLLQSLQVNLHQIKSFSFMKRKQQKLSSSGAPAKGQYGPGILTLHLQDGKEKTVCLPPFRHPSSVVRFLVANGIAFDNYTPRQRTIGEIPTTTYQRTSLYMFWFFVLFLTFLILGYYSIGLHAWWGFLTAFASFALSLFFICMLMTRFCYLTLTNEALVIHSIGRTIRYPVPKPAKGELRFCPRAEFHTRHGIVRQSLPLPAVLHRKGVQKEAERDCRTAATGRSGRHLQPERPKEILSG